MRNTLLSVTRTFVPLMITALVACGCQPAARTDTPKKEEPLSLTQVTLLSDADGKAGSELSKFDYRQRTLHFRAVLSRPVEQAKSRWIFTAKQTVAGNNRAIQSLEGTIVGTDMSAEITLKNDWPVGTYHVDVVIEDAPVGGFDFEVTGEKSKIAFMGHSLAPDDGHGLPGQPVKVFSYPVKTIHLQVSTRGVDTTEPEVVWRLYQVSGGKQLELGQTVQPKVKLQDSVLKCMFESPKAWAKGDYRADIFLAGKKAHSISFQVK